MNELIRTEDISYGNNEIKMYLEKMDTQSLFQIDQLVFYPYFFFEYSLDRKSFFHPIGGTVGCAVDGINGVCAIIDKVPQFNEKVISTQSIMMTKLNASDATAIAEPFLYDSISYKMKIFSMPTLNLSKQEVFYRPYWIAEGKSNSSDQFFITVDAVTGKYHPL